MIMDSLRFILSKSGTSQFDNEMTLRFMLLLNINFGLCEYLLTMLYFISANFNFPSSFIAIKTSLVMTNKVIMLSK
jgi:hypothetical protein